jgi:glycogen synthase
LDAAAPDHASAKRKLQQKYFNFQDLDDSIPLFAFVGRVTAQKGVHLILDIAEHII